MIDIGKWFLEVVMLPLAVVVWLRFAKISKDGVERDKKILLLEAGLLTTGREIKVMQANHDNELSQFRDLVKELKDELHSMRVDINTGLSKLGDKLFEIIQNDK